MNQGKKVFTFAGEGGSQMFVFPCPTHAHHLCFGFGEKGVASCLELTVAEAMNVVDVLRAGPSWAGLSGRAPLAGHPEAAGDRQGAFRVGSGIFCITVRGDSYIVSIAPTGWPTVMAIVGPDAREKVTAAMCELAYGREVAA